MTTELDVQTGREAYLMRLAMNIGPALAEHAARHDQEGSWINESFDQVRDSGLLAMAVPDELGGIGATLREVAMVQRELAKHCASTALATAMHQHVTAFTAWRYRRGLPGAAELLRQIADDGVVLLSTGGADLTHPRGTATKVAGGYRVTGRKVFVSQSHAGTILSTMFVYDDPERGRRVLNMMVPCSTRGVQVVDNWNALGMRGTDSNDVELDDVLVAEERVLADRPYGVLDPPLQVMVSIASPIISAVYLGVAEGARDDALRAVAGRASDRGVQRQVGLIEYRLRIAAWALDGALAVVGDDPQPSMETVAAATAAKREIALAGIEVCDLAMDLAGGAAFVKGSRIERAYRDIRASKFHPLSAEDTLLHAGRLALGVACDVI